MLEVDVDPGICRQIDGLFGGFIPYIGIDHPVGTGGQVDGIETIYIGHSTHTEAVGDHHTGTDEVFTGFSVFDITA